MKVFLNIVAVIMALIGLVLFFVHPPLWVILVYLAWWSIGIYAAFRHLKLSETVQPFYKNLTFYVWYSLNGPILLVVTIAHEIWTEILNRRCQ